MSKVNLPLLVEPQNLEPLLGNAMVLVVSVDSAHRYHERHIPRAVHLSYDTLVRRGKFALGLLPDVGALSQALSGIGLTPETHVVAYDDEGCGRSSRLLWTLGLVGHEHFSLLNGGLTAWANEGHPLHVQPVDVVASDYTVSGIGDAIVDKTYLLAHYSDPSVVLLDCRSHNEFIGLQPLAKYSGHIPGAVNLDWSYTKSSHRHNRYKPMSKLQVVLDSLGITKDKEVIVYCQTGHRSSHTFMLLKILGYPNVKAYPGSWSEWGNCDDTPIIQIETPEESEWA